MSKLRIAQYGCGKMSKYSMRYVYEKGAEIVAAFDVNPAVVGRDIGSVMGGPERGVVVQHANEADKVLAALKPDACIITTMSLMRDIAEAAADRAVLIITHAPLPPGTVHESHRLIDGRLWPDPAERS